MDTIWNFPLSTCTLSQQKSYISKGIQPNFENFASARSCWRWAYGWEAAGAQVFYFCNDQAKTLRMDTIWNFPLSTCTRYQQKPYISKFNRPIFENFASGRSCWRWAYGWKVSGAQLFYFCNDKVKSLHIDNIWNIPLSTCTLSQQKSYISKGIQPNFENFASARSCWRWAYGWKAAGAQVFYFCNDQAKTLRMDTIWNFPLSTCTLSQQKPYISKVNQPIFEDFASARSCWRWAYGCIFSRCAGILSFAMARWKLCATKTFEISHFQPVHCTSKNPGSPKLPNRFSKTLLQFDVVEGGHMSGKLQVHRYFTFPITRWKARQTFGWIFSGAQVFYFCDGKVKTLPNENIWNFPLSTCTLSQQKPHISKTFFRRKHVEGGYLGRKV